jgi:hypothetical protein
MALLRDPDGLFHRTAVFREGDVVVKETGPWAATVYSLLRHLEEVGFRWAPPLVGFGTGPTGRPAISYSYVEGEFTQPGPWSLEGAAEIGRMLRALHDATTSYRPPPDAQWKPWFGRALGGPARVVGHCDLAPWNLVARGGLPVALIDWEVAGPVDPLIELCQACWLNAKLHDDLVAEREDLPPLADRARQLHAIVDGYGLAARQRRGLVDRMVEMIVHDTAAEADDLGVTSEEVDDPRVAWAIAWPIRSAAWILRHRSTLQNALAR